MDYSELKDGGIYRLVKDVKNPYSNRRYKHRPNTDKVWKKGTRFIARERYRENDYGGDVGMMRVTWFELEWLDYRLGFLHAVSVREEEKQTDCGRFNNARANAIMAVLAPAQEDQRAGLIAGKSPQTPAY